MLLADAFIQSDFKNMCIPQESNPWFSVASAALYQLSYMMYFWHCVFKEVIHQKILIT